MSRAREHDYGNARQPVATIGICIVGKPKCPNWNKAVDLGDGWCVDCYESGIQHPQNKKSVVPNLLSTNDMQLRKQRFNTIKKGRK